MGGGGSEVKETPQQRAQAELAMNQMLDYKKRWLPVQRELATQIQRLGSPQSAERIRARGQAATETAQQFSDARREVEAGLAAAGAGLSSGKAKMALGGMADAQAASAGFGLAAADQAVDDAYTAGLSQIMALGRGERAAAISGMDRVADMSARQAQADARMAAERSIGRGQLVGQIAGLGIGAVAGRPPTPAEPNFVPIVPGDSPLSATSEIIRARR